MVNVKICREKNIKSRITFSSFDKSQDVKS